MSSVDLEYGQVTLSKQMKRLVDYYRKNERKIKYFAIGFVVLTVALIIKLGFNNVDTVIETATAITLDESAYQPFKWSENIIVSVDAKGVKKFPIKESHVNWKMQSLNIIQAREHVMEYLKKGGYLCIHMRHFNVPYDIIVFQNVTMVNPLVEKESDTYRYVKEESLDGTTSRQKRPETLDIVYYDEGLNRQFITLYGNQASCFAHYNFE
jgi:hypothetical protein